MGVQVEPLVPPAQLSRWGIPSAFLAQFEPRPIDVQIETAGALGTMSFVWRWAGDEAWSPAIVSDDDATSWVYELEDAFATLTFAAQSYVAATASRIDRNGLVTGGSGITAARYDQRAQACSSVTAEVMMRVADAVFAPLVTWTDDWRTHSAQMVYAVLKRGKGATPGDAGGSGDANIFLAEDIARKFFDHIGKSGRPDGIVDTPVSTDGPLIPAMPSGDALRGW